MVAPTRWRHQSSAAGSQPVSHLLMQTVLQQYSLHQRGRPQQHLQLSSNPAAGGAQACQQRLCQVQQRRLEQ